MFWLDSGIQLLGFLKSNFENIVILSAPSKENFNFSIDGKTIWITRNIGPNQKFILDDFKGPYANKDVNNILIDDSEKNIQAWKDNGGTAILHDPRMQFKTIDALEALLKE